MREDLITQVYLFCKKISMPAFYTLLGIMANYTDHYRKGTLTKRQAIISGLFGIVSGADKTLIRQSYICLTLTSQGIIIAGIDSWYCPG